MSELHKYLYIYIILFPNYHALMSAVDWSSHIKIDRTLVTSQLNQHFIEIDHKLTLRFYTLKPSGTQILMDGLCTILHDNLPYYVYGDKQFAELGPIKAALRSSHFFGHKDPSSDGKYGELLLFMLVESLLGCKMIAHKIRALTNVVDQVKGGDGIFLGNYDINGSPHPAYLIGESKVTATFANALNEALLSINRFYEGAEASIFRDHELIVAKESLRSVDVDLDELYDRLTPTTELFRQQIVVHPILLMYKLKDFTKLCQDSTTTEELQTGIEKLFIGKEKRMLEKIKQKVDPYTELKKVYLDFFIFPCESVDTFRKIMYQKIHASPYSS
jgi:hypothetical protein